jgi:hypothetical protein
MIFYKKLYLPPPGTAAGTVTVTPLLQVTVATAVVYGGRAPYRHFKWRLVPTAIYKCGWRLFFPILRSVV